MAFFWGGEVRKFHVCMHGLGSVSTQSDVDLLRGVGGSGGVDLY